VSDPDGPGVLARGRVFADEEAQACANAVAVEFERLKRGEWRPRGSDRTDDLGRFRAVLTQGRGRYRATAVAFEFTATGVIHRCEQALGEDRLPRRR
jgi:hypothetical protein